MKIKRVYFIGIGGIGMSALARYYSDMGAVVSGYDKTPSEITNQLSREGMDIHFEDNIERIDLKADLVIYTPAIPSSHSELNYYLNNGFEVIKRSVALGNIAKDYFTIAVAGSHGKTTTSAMIAWLLRNGGVDCTALLGGISNNFNSNYIKGESKVLVVEADEFDRSFHQLHPDIAVITAIDSDHLDIYGTPEKVSEAFGVFANQVKEGGALFIRHGVSLPSNSNTNQQTYHVSDEHADLHSTSFEIDENGSHVTLNNGMHFTMRYPGIHNIENAIGAISVALKLGISPDQIEDSLYGFTGIHRRFERVIEQGGVVLYDDYAHHPGEIEMLIKSLKKMFSGRKITIVFQPHLYSRTRDLATEFATALSEADHVILLPIYPARELPIENVSSEIIANKMRRPAELIEKNQLTDALNAYKQEIICMTGAGDIDRLVKDVAQWITKTTVS